MDDLKKIRAKSNRFALVLILEIAFCALIGFANSQFFQLAAVTFSCYALIFAVPLVYNVKWYFSAKVQNDAMEMHYAIIAEILVLIFAFQFLI